MGLIKDTAYNYYGGSQSFLGDGLTINFNVVLTPQPKLQKDIFVYVNGEVLNDDEYTYENNVLTIGAYVLDDDGNVVLDENGDPTIDETNPPLLEFDQVVVTLVNKQHGNYRYTSLADLVNNFMVSYVGDGKIINRAKRRDILFHAKRAMQEFAFDIAKVEKIQEIELGPNLSIPMPQDYVNYVAFSYVDEYGVEHPINRGRITSSPSEAILQDDDALYMFDDEEQVIKTTSLTDERLLNLDARSLTGSYNNEDYFYNRDYPAEKLIEAGKRYGGTPELMNKNGFFYIDEYKGAFKFSSNLVGAIITIKYVSDSLGTDEEMKVHKFAEEALYKYVAHAILSTMAQVPEYIVNRFKRERRAAMRNAKLRLYDLKLPELTNVMRGKSKHIKS
jgi:hypothetical protein